VSNRGRSRPCRIAHLSDLHVLAPLRAVREPTAVELRTRLASFGRPLDAEARALKVLAAIGAAKARGADHFVFSGDLTELGTDGQFEALAELLHEARLDPDSVTLVPGNHDAYAAPDSWRRALDGPLAAFRRASADEPGKLVDASGLALLPLDVTFHQPLGRAAGELTADAAGALERRLRECANARLPAAIVMHHSPIPHASRAWQWIDGLQGHGRLNELLRRFGDVCVLHGHLHSASEKALGGSRPRLFGTTATVEDEPGEPRVRFYEVRDGQLERRLLSVAPVREAA